MYSDFKFSLFNFITFGILIQKSIYKQRFNPPFAVHTFLVLQSYTYNVYFYTNYEFILLAGHIQYWPRLLTPDSYIIFILLV